MLAYVFRNKLVYKYMGRMFIYFIIALIAINLIYSPVMRSETGHYVELGGIEYINGLQARARIWKAYPRYNIGMGIIVLLAFSGALFEIASIYELEKPEEDEAEVGECER